MFAELDWRSQDFFTYLALASGVIVVLAMGLYAAPNGRLKVSGIVVSIVGSLGLGLALGVILMGLMGYQLKEQPSQGGPPGMGGPPVMGGPPGMGIPVPNPQAQLAALVDKLDLLTGKPLTVQLSDEQRKEISEQLKGLADVDELTDDVARAKVDKLDELLKDQKSTLEAVGYRGPAEGMSGGMPALPGPGGRGGVPGPPPVPNPFKVEDNAKHLKALTNRLAGGGNE
jgi:hypothetical protein